MQRSTPRQWHSQRYIAKMFARRPAKVAAVAGFVLIGGALVYALASSQETNTVPVCNQATQVNTTCTAQNALTLAQPTGWWHTSGNQILDSANNQVSLRGVDDGRMVPTNSGTLAASEYSNLNNWGFDFIRLGVSWANLEPTAPTGVSGALSHAWNQSYLTAIDSVVKQAAANHLKIVLDMHQVNWSPKFSGTGMPAWLFPANPTEGTAKCEFMTGTVEAGVPESQQAGLIATEQMLAARYQSDPTVVGMDMFNEPQSCNYNGAQTYAVPTGGTPYDDFYHNAGTALRQTSPNLLLIYEDDAYQSYLKIGFAVSRALDLPNAVYSSHMYPDAWAAGNDGTTCQPATSVTGQQVYQAHLDKANGWNQPFYLGEFDGFHLAANACTAQSGASQDLLAMMADAKAHNVNWSLWEYDRSAQSMIDSSGNPKQPLLSDLQTGLGGSTRSGSSGSVTLCRTGSGTLNSWDSVAVSADVPANTTVAVKVATAAGTCGALTSQSSFSTPIAISDSSSGGSSAHSLAGMGLANSQSLLIEVDLASTDASVTPTVNSLTLSDTPQGNNPPSVPTGLSATPGLTSVALSWSASSDDTDPASALIYKVFRGGNLLGQTAGGTTYTDSGLTQHTNYSYTVVACDTQSSCSAPSGALLVTTKSDTTAPTVPTNLTVTVGSTTAALAWTASTDPDNTAAQLTYRIYRNTVQVGTSAAGATSYADSGLKTGTQYSYAIAACDPTGNCSAKTALKTVKTTGKTQRSH